MIPEFCRQRAVAWKRWGLSRAAVAFSRRFAPQFPEAFGILMYHRVCSPPNDAPALTGNVTPERLRSQLSGLIDRGYRPWPLRKALALHDAGEPIPRHVFVVTFDDGYANAYHYAWPILKELKVPATIFLATAFLDSQEPFPFDDWAAAGSCGIARESWLPLTSLQCTQLLDDGLIELGAHTHTHADFRNRPDALRGDLERCMNVLRHRFGLCDATFAYPYGTKKLGYADTPLMAAVRETRALCGLTSEATLVTPTANKFEWGRFTVESDDTSDTLAAKLDGWYSKLRSVKAAISNL